MTPKSAVENCDNVRQTHACRKWLSADDIYFFQLCVFASIGINFGDVQMALHNSQTNKPVSGHL